MYKFRLRVLSHLGRLCHLLQAGRLSKQGTSTTVIKRIVSKLIMPYLFIQNKTVLTGSD